MNSTLKLCSNSVSQSRIIEKQKRALTLTLLSKSGKAIDAFDVQRGKDENIFSDVFFLFFRLFPIEISFARHFHLEFDNENSRLFHGNYGRLLSFNASSRFFPSFSNERNDFPKSVVELQVRLRRETFRNEQNFFDFSSR